MKHIEKFVEVSGEAYNGMTIKPKLGANHVDTENFRFRTGGGCRIELGCLFCRSGGQTAWPSCEQTPACEEKKLHPACKRYLERRAAWYRYKGNKAELRENHKAAKAFRGLPYAEQKIQCQAAYQAFDDFDHGKFRRR